MGAAAIDRDLCWCREAVVPQWVGQPLNFAIDFVQHYVTNLP
jgi:hypothetical protein